MSLLSRLILVLLCSVVPTFGRADPCNGVNDLMAIYADLYRVHDAAARVSPEVARQLLLAASRINPTAMQNSLAESSIGQRAGDVVEPLRMLRSAGRTQVGDEVYLTGLDRPNVGRMITEAIDRLSGLGCPAPERVESSAGTLWDPTLGGPGADGGLIRYWGGGAAFVAMLLLVAGLVWQRDRSTRLKQRHICAISVHMNGSGRGPSDAKVIDLSQEGAKISVPETEGITIGNHVTLEIGGMSLDSTIRWGNSHVIGVQFQQRLPRATLNKLLALSQSKSRQDGRSPKGRAA